MHTEDSQPFSVLVLGEIVLCSVKLVFAQKKRFGISAYAGWKTNQSMS